jgi:SAM-dependent methyltransferase
VRWHAAAKRDLCESRCVDDDYRMLNRANWDERAPAHAASKDYALDRFVADPTFISDVVRFDLPLLGDVKGLRGVHLQCHIGTDTISLSRLGATMTGLDFSPAAIAEARKLVARTGDQVDFVESDVYDAVEVLGGSSYDLVFTGIGALGWLPSIARWAETVAGLLKPGGRLFIREGHPVLWSIDERITTGPTLGHSYFEHVEPLVWTEGGTYVETDVEFTHNTTHEWNHGLGEIVTALLANGFEITALAEHDSVPWEALPGQMTRDDQGEWRLTENPARLPASYTLQARKR